MTQAYNQVHGTDWPVRNSVKDYAAGLLDYQRMVAVLRDSLGYME